MALVIQRSLATGVDKRFFWCQMSVTDVLSLLSRHRGLTRHKPPTVRHGQLQGRRRGPLVVPRRIIGVPHQDAGHARVRANGHEARHAKLDRRGRHIGNDGVACDGDGERAEHHGPSQAEAV